VDIKTSKLFLRKLKTPSFPVKHALDVGAGIGRVTANLLSQYAESVDVLEPVDHFVEQLRRHQTGKIGHVLHMSLQDWPARQQYKYDLIWCQWCLGQLKDKDLVRFFVKAKQCLTADGAIIVKENVHWSAEDDFDKLDHSITRTSSSFRRIFAEADLKVEKA
jgi:protein N-terminal methyltransferase